MSKKKIKQSSIIEPTEEELALYHNIIADVHEGDIDVWANEYFELAQKEEIDVSFARFVIDKIIRPVKPGDTINYTESNGKVGYLYCLVRETVEEKDYLLFAKVNDDTEEIIPEMVYLFQVIGYDEVGMEIIDIMETGPEAERILDIMEEMPDVEMADTAIGEIGDIPEETL